MHCKATLLVLNNDNAVVYTRTGQLNVESINIVLLQPRRAAGPGVPALFAQGPLDHQLVTRKGVRQIYRRMLGIFHSYPEAA